MNIPAVGTIPPLRYSIPQSCPDFQLRLPQNAPVQFGSAGSVAGAALRIATIMGACVMGVGYFCYRHYNPPPTPEQQIQKLEDQQQEIQKKIDEAKKLEQQQQELQKKIDEIKAPQ